MKRVTLTHIGAVSLGKLLATWTFVLGLILMIISGIFMLLATLLGMAASNNPLEAFGGGVIGFIMFVVSGVIGLVFTGIGMFIFGALAATVYNIILGVGGGIDMDFKERAN
jgi:hypothetical protein